MGYTQKLGLLAQSVFQDSSLNVGIGGAPSGSYKFEVTGTAKVSSTLLVSGASTLTGAVGIGIAAPSSGLEVYVSGGGPTLRVTNSGTGTGSGNGFHIGTDASSPYNVAFVQNENAAQVFYTNNGTSTDERLRITSTGRIYNSNAPANSFAYEINASTTTSQSYGLTMYAGTNSSDAALVINNGTGSVSNLFKVRGDGNVGIGTSSPSYKLDVLGSSGVIAKFSDGTTNSFIYSGSNSSAFGSDATIQNGIIMNGANSTAQINTNGQIRLLVTSGGYTKATNSGSYYSSAGGLFHEFDQSTSNQDTMWIYNTASSGYGLTINMPNTGSSGTNYFLRGSNGTSAYYLYSNGSSTFSSDRNLKKNIETTRNGYLEDIMNLRVVKYNWITQEDGEAKELGLIAQEVAEIFPSLVVDQSIPKTREIKQEDGSIVEEQYEVTQKGLKVSVLPFMLLKAMQEQQATITSLQDRLDKAGL